jgi:hypothetical protein
MRMRHAYGMALPQRSLRQWQPATHDYRGQGVPLYDDALLLVDAAHIQVGDHVCIGSPQGAHWYRVRHVAYSVGYPAYWRVRIERLEGAPAACGEGGQHEG